MADAPINVQQVQNAGDGYTVPASLDLILKAARCAFDGSGAGGDFVPTLQIVSDAGLVVAECPISETVTAGASADVTWFPALIPARASTGGGGIQFDTAPQAGTFLYAEATGSGGPESVAFEFVDTHDNGFYVFSTFTLIGDVTQVSGGALFGLRGSGMRADITDGQSFAVAMAYNGTRALRINNASGTPQIGFFGAAPVAQPAAPVTLANVITALKNLGLTA